MTNIEKLIRLPEVLERTGMKKTALYARIKRGEFPAQVKNGPMSVWAESEVQEWIDLRKQGRKAA